MVMLRMAVMMLVKVDIEMMLAVMVMKMHMLLDPFLGVRSPWRSEILEATLNLRTGVLLSDNSWQQPQTSILVCFYILVANLKLNIAVPVCPLAFGVVALNGFRSPWCFHQILTFLMHCLCILIMP